MERLRTYLRGLMVALALVLAATPAVFADTGAPQRAAADAICHPNVKQAIKDYANAKRMQASAVAAANQPRPKKITETSCFGDLMNMMNFKIQVTMTWPTDEMIKRAIQTVLDQLIQQILSRACDKINEAWDKSVGKTIQQFNSKLDSVNQTIVNLPRTAAGMVPRP